MADDFCKFFNATVKKHTIEPADGKRHRNKPNDMSDAEIISILIMFHSCGHRCLKHFYKNHICEHCSSLFSKLLSYNRFVELEKEVLFGLVLRFQAPPDHKREGGSTQLVTKLKNNMKNCLMSVSDKVLLRKRAVIETVNDELKNIAQIEHSRHRSLCNFMVNAVAAIAAYCFFPKKPSISVEAFSDNQLVLF